MRTDMNKLRGAIVEKGTTQESLAICLGIDSSTFTRKMKASGLSFTVGQMHKIVETLNLSAEDARQIFLQ